MIGNGTFANGVETKLDASLDPLAVAGDYHNGPLSTLIPFGIWGGITFVWFMFAGLRVVYRNHKYGDAQLRLVNIYLLVQCFIHIINYFFIFGGYGNDMLGFAETIGFSIALNRGVLGPQPQTLPVTQTQPKAIIRPELQPV